MPDLKNKVPDLGVKVPDPKLEVPDLRSSGIRLNLTPGLQAGYDVDHRLIRKRAVDFLLVIIELFPQLLRLWSYERT